MKKIVFNNNLNSFDKVISIRKAFSNTVYLCAAFFTYRSQEYQIIKS